MLLGQVGSGHPWAGKDRNAESRAGKQVSALPPSFPPFVSVFPFPLFPHPHTPPATDVLSERPSCCSRLSLGDGISSRLHLHGPGPSSISMAHSRLHPAT